MISIEATDESRFMQLGESVASSIEPDLSGAILTTGGADNTPTHPAMLGPDGPGPVDEAISNEEFESYYNRYYPEVFGFLRKQGNKTVVAEDLAQEVFLRVFVHIGKCAVGSNYRAWIFQVSRNICIDHYRKDREVPFDPVSVPVPVIASADPSELIEDKELLEVIQSTELTAAQTDLLQQVLMGRQSPGEYAKANNIDPQALYSRIDRLKRRLRSSLAECL